MVKIVVRQVAQAHQVTQGGGDRAADDQSDQHECGHDHEAHRDEQHHRAQLPHRPALVDLVDPVHGPSEGTHVARGRPDRGGEPEHQGQSRATGAHELVDGALQLVGDLALAELPHEVEQGGGRRLALTEQAEQRDEGEDRGKDGEDRVVGQGGRQVGALVALELGERRLGGVLPPGLVDLLDRVDLSRVVGLRCRSRPLRGGAFTCHALAPTPGCRPTHPRRLPSSPLRGADGAGRSSLRHVGGGLRASGGRLWR